jgi:hypothetical protein
MDAAPFNVVTHVLGETIKAVDIDRIAPHGHGLESLTIGRTDISWNHAFAFLRYRSLE